MNKTFIIYVFFIVVSILFGCNSKDNIYKQLVIVDSLTHKNLPDSAYHNLQKIKSSIKSDKEKAYYGLLLTRIMHMQNNPLKSDSLVSASIEYYKKTGENYKLAEAYFTKGKNLYFRGYIKQAIYNLKECEKQITILNDRPLIIELYNFLSMVNSRDGENKIALQYAKNALAIAEYDKKWYGEVCSYNRMAIVYAKLRSEDSACFYINKCIPHLKHLLLKDKIMIMNNIGYLYQDRDPKFALKYLNMALAMHPDVDTYDNLAQIYYKQGMKAKADSLWSKALISKDVEKRCEIVEAMLRQKAITEDKDEALRLSQWLIGLKDSVSKKRQENNVKELQLEYDAQAAELEQQAHIRNLYWIVCVCIIVALAVCALGWLYIRNKRLTFRTKQLERLRVIHQYQDAIRDLELKNHEAENAITGMEKNAKDSKRQIDKMKAKLEKIQAQNAEDEQKAYMLYQTAMQGLYIREWKKADYKAFINHYAKKDLAFLTTLDEYKELTPREATYLILQHEGKDDDTIKDMMDISVSTLRTMKSRIKNKKQEQEIEI